MVLILLVLIIKHPKLYMLKRRSLRLMKIFTLWATRVLVSDVVNLAICVVIVPLFVILVNRRVISRPNVLLLTLQLIHPEHPVRLVVCLILLIALVRPFVVRSTVGRKRYGNLLPRAVIPETGPVPIPSDETIVMIAIIVINNALRLVRLLRTVVPNRNARKPL